MKWWILWTFLEQASMRSRMHGLGGKISTLPTMLPRLCRRVYNSSAWQPCLHCKTSWGWRGFIHWRSSTRCMGSPTVHSVVKRGRTREPWITTYTPSTTTWALHTPSVWPSSPPVQIPWGNTDSTERPPLPRIKRKKKHWTGTTAIRMTNSSPRHDPHPQWEPMSHSVQPIPGIHLPFHYNSFSYCVFHLFTVALHSITKMVFLNIKQPSVFISACQIPTSRQLY